MFDVGIETQAAAQQVAAPVQEVGIGTVLQTYTPIVSDAVQTGIGFYQKGKLEKEVADIHEELKGLDKTFTSISEGIKSGANRRALHTRARAALNAAKAASPMLSDYADELYANYFGSSGVGSSGGAGSFQLTPAEKQAEEMSAQVAEMTMLGWTEDQAVGYLQAVKQGEMAKTYADTLANQSKVNMYQVQPITDSLFVESEAKFQYNLQNSLYANGGTLPQDIKINMTRDIDAWAVQTKARIQKMVTDPKTGAYIISPEEATKMLDRVDLEADSQKKILNDNSYQKFLADRKEIRSNEANIVAIEAYPQLAVIRAAGGDQAANTWLDAKIRNDPRLAKWIESTDPTFRAFFNGDPLVGPRISVKSASKLFGGTEEDQLSGRPIRLTPTESAVAGGMVASNAALAINILEKASNLAGIKSMTENYPQALAATFNNSTQSIRKEKAATFKEKIQAMQNGALNSFNSLYRSEFGRFPSGIQIVVEKPDLKKINKSYYNRQRALQTERITVNTQGGERLDQSMVNIIGDLYRSVKSNPDALPEPLKVLTPEQAVTVWINSGASLEDITEPMVAEIAEDLGFSYGTEKPAQPVAEAKAEPKKS